MKSPEYKKKIYISGPMTGVEEYESKFNYAESLLKQSGYSVFNPSWNKFDESWAYKDILAIDLSTLMHCDAIFMLDGWENSRGAQMEHELAEKLGLDILYEVLFVYNQNEEGE